MGEPQLGRRGLFNMAGELGLMWLLNYSDGNHSLLDIAEISGIDFASLMKGADELERVGLLAKLSR